MIAIFHILQSLFFYVDNQQDTSYAPFYFEKSYKKSHIPRNITDNISVYKTLIAPSYTGAFRSTLYLTTKEIYYVRRFP